MALTQQQFIANVVASELMSAAALESFLQAMPAAERPKDAETLARALVRAKRLTRFQAESLYKGQTKGLVLGDYVVLDKIGQGGIGVVFKAAAALVTKGLIKLP